MTALGGACKQKMENAILNIPSIWFWYKHEDNLLNSLSFTKFIILPGETGFQFAHSVCIQLSGNSNCLILLFSPDDKWNISFKQLQPAKKSFFNFSDASVVLYATHFHVNQRLILTVSIVSSWNSNCTRKWSDIHSTPMHSIPFTSFRLSVCSYALSPDCESCDYYYNYLRLSPSFTRNFVSSTPLLALSSTAVTRQN